MEQPELADHLQTSGTFNNEQLLHESEDCRKKYPPDKVWGESQRDLTSFSYRVHSVPYFSTGSHCTFSCIHSTFSFHSLKIATRFNQFPNPGREGGAQACKYYNSFIVFCDLNRLANKATIQQLYNREDAKDARVRRRRQRENIDIYHVKNYRKKFSKKK